MLISATTFFKGQTAQMSEELLEFLLQTRCHVSPDEWATWPRYRRQFFTDFLLRGGA